MTRVERAVANLESWLRTWEKDNAVYGYVVHQHKENLSSLQPDVLTHVGMILAYLNLYKKTRQQKWLTRAVNLADYLVKIYEPRAHLFRASAFEHKPRATTLVYNAFACYALLKLYQIRKKKSYLKVSKDCIDKALIQKFWDPTWKAFMDTDTGIHTLNMGSVAIAALVQLAKITRVKKYVDYYATHQASLVLHFQKKHLKMKGAYHYDDSGKWRRFISLYQAWTMIGILELYEYTGDKKYLQSLKQCRLFILNRLLDKKTGLFYHRYDGRTKKKYPEFVAASGAVLSALKKLDNHLPQLNLTAILNRILPRQRRNGSFPNTVGYTNIFIPWATRPNPDETVWRDWLAIPGWNALMFEALTEFLPNKPRLPKPKIADKIQITTSDGYNVVETSKDVDFYKSKNLVAHFSKTNPEETLITNELNLYDAVRIKALKRYKQIAATAFLIGAGFATMVLYFIAVT